MKCIYCDYKMSSEVHFPAHMYHAHRWEADHKLVRYPGALVYILVRRLVDWLNHLVS